MKYQTKGGVKQRHFYNEGFRTKDPLNDKRIDNQPNSICDAGRTSLVARLKAEQCELCGAKGRLVMHHVRKLKNLEGKKSWERHMIARKRKTIAVCESCHQYIHLGKID